MWLIIFPEGTNLSATTREKSKKWAEKNNLQDMKHQLLPRSTGLRFCLNELKDTTEWLYDCTIAYEGVPPGQFGQDIFTLRSSFFEGRPPKSVNMHWRRFHISTIPIQNTKAFEVWLRNRWREKDYMLEYFNRHTRFPAEDFWTEHLDMSSRSSQQSRSLRSVPKPAVQIETQVKSGNWNEFVKIFAPISSVMMALTVAYGASPGDLIPGGKEFFEQHMQALLGQGDMKSLPSPDQLEKMIEGAARMGAEQAAEPKNKPQVQKLTQENLAKLVKETAIKNGIGMRRVSTALPSAPTHLIATAKASAPQKAKSAVNLPSTTNNPAAAAAAKAKAANAVNAKSNPTPTKLKAPAKPKPAPPSGPMKEATTASGVTIKIPKTDVEEAKKTGTIVTKSGLVIRIGKDEIEEAQKKSGTMVMTASGTPIKVTSSGAMTVEQKSSMQQSGKYTIVPAAKKPAPAAVKAPPRLNTATQKSASAPKKLGLSTAGKQTAATGTVKKSTASPPKLSVTKGPSKNL